MAWDRSQQIRLTQEHAVLSMEYPRFAFYEPTGRTYVHGQWTSNLGNLYGLRVELPPGYPDECPSTYVTYPSPLRGYSRKMTRYGTSHAMHTWKTDRYGWVKICTYRSAHWSAAHSLAKVIRKGQLWIVAYEIHCKTGRPIADYLREG